jgi:hypothetical protein
MSKLTHYRPNLYKLSPGAKQAEHRAPGRLSDRTVVGQSEKTFPRGLKPHSFDAFYGTTEVVPLQSMSKLTHYRPNLYKLSAGAKQAEQWAPGKLSAGL